ncbi:hypothetical protein AA103196_0472 [Ameyamaea chiangmaiensis NBRC 103196]|nr:hypothetical protein AA103196_0472 [Ameyamaea chiangmaiensis NBRC 103196]
MHQAARVGSGGVQVGGDGGDVVQHVRQALSGAWHLLDEHIPPQDKGFNIIAKKIRVIQLCALIDSSEL